MHRKSSRWVLAGVLIAAHAGTGCALGSGLLISGGTGVITVAQLEDGRWAKGYVSRFQPNGSWNLRVKGGGYMTGEIISEKEALAALPPPPSATAGTPDADSRTTPPPTEPGGEVGPGPGPDPDPGAGPDPDPDPDPGTEPGPDPDPDPETGCGVDYEC